jgi:hypothetical protein
VDFTGSIGGYGEVDNRKKRVDPQENENIKGIGQQREYCAEQDADA